MNAAIEYWPFGVYVGAVVVVIAGKLLASHFLGERHRERVTGEAYESGILPTGTGRLRFSIKFFLIAILFVIFDLELVFIFAWAVAIHELGWPGFWGLMVFMGILTVGLIYEWRMGSLDWIPRRPANKRSRPSTLSSKPEPTR
ncbi:MAG: NADH-quinone oxidoreductase subunit A [Opitutales bacterium]|nr:NADH-quinone oxidoreductase subunit A [Opitutales bacterium]